MINDEQGFTWARCDICGLTLGVGFNAGRAEAMSAFKQWGWDYAGGKVTCRFCIKERRV